MDFLIIIILLILVFLFIIFRTKKEKFDIIYLRIGNNYLSYQNNMLSLTSTKDIAIQINKLIISDKLRLFFKNGDTKYLGFKNNKLTYDTDITNFDAEDIGFYLENNKLFVNKNNVKYYLGNDLNITTDINAAVNVIFEQ